MTRHTSIRTTSVVPGNTSHPYKVEGMVILRVGKFKIRFMGEVWDRLGVWPRDQ